MLTIVAYHYVRNIKNSKHNRIKGLEINEFNTQLNYIKKNYTVISADDIFDFYLNNEKIPNNSALLTFDDGYIDHYVNVLPLLESNNIKGSFYIPASPIEKNIVLDVNKIQFLINAFKDIKLLINEIKDEINELKKTISIKEFEEYYNIFAVANRWDNKETIFVKRFLQKGLTRKLRSKLIHKLFIKYVSIDESEFSNNLYMNFSQIRDLKSQGHHIGCHGDHHLWWNLISNEEIHSEIDSSLKFLKKIGCDTSHWSACYPYGGVDKKCTKILSEKNCQFALTTKVGVSNLNLDNRLLLPRLDTNDLPTI